MSVTPPKLLVTFSPNFRSYPKTSGHKNNSSNNSSHSYISSNIINRGTSNGLCEMGVYCWRAVRVIFAHFSYFGLRLVSEQRQSFRSTRLFFDWEDSNHITLFLLFGRDGPLFFVVPCTPFVCHLGCPELHDMFLACGFLETSMSVSLSRSEIVLPSSSRNASLPWSRDEVHLLIFFVPEPATLTSCFFFFQKKHFFERGISVGGRRLKSPEEQCAEFPARARQTIRQTGKKEVEHRKSNSSNNSSHSYISSNIINRGTSNGQCEMGVYCWRAVRVIFAHFSSFGSEQRQSFRSTRLFFDWGDSNHITLFLLFGRDGPLFFVVPCTPFVCHLGCPELHDMFLACGFLETSMSVSLSRSEIVLLSSSRNASLPKSRDEVHLLVFFSCQNLRRSRVVFFLKKSTFLNVAYLSVVAASSHLRSIVPSSQLAPARPSVKLARRRSNIAKEYCLERYHGSL